MRILNRRVFLELTGATAGAAVLTPTLAQAGGHRAAEVFTAAFRWAWREGGAWTVREVGELWHAAGQELCHKWYGACDVDGVMECLDIM